MTLRLVQDAPVPQLARRAWPAAPLALILGAQAALSVRLITSTPVFGDEALYIWGGHMEWNMWLHGAANPELAGYFSGAPVLYPPLAAAADSGGGLPGARLLSLVFMLAATVLLYLTARRLYGRTAALSACALFAVLGSTLHLGAYATYDAMALFLLAAAAFSATRISSRPVPWILATAAAMALANATKYASLLWDPVIIGTAGLASWKAGKKDVMNAVSVAGCAAIMISGLLLAGGSRYWRGITRTTLERHSSTTPALTVLGHAGLWIGILLALAAAGILASRATRPLRWLLVVFLAAGLLAPLDEAHTRTMVSLVKHVDFGGWFAAIPAGVAVAWFLATVTSRPVRGTATALAAAALVSLGARQALAITSGETRAGNLQVVLHQILAGQSRPLVLTDQSEPAHAWPPLAPRKSWVVIYGGQNLGSDSAQIAANKAMISRHAFTLIILGFTGSARVQDEGYRAVIRRNHAYQLIRMVAWTGPRRGQFDVWQRLPRAAGSQ